MSGLTLENISSFPVLRRSALKAKKNIRITPTIAAYCNRLEDNTLRLQASLRDGSYHPKPFTVFAIRDPKPRLIHAAAFVDRVVHHAICAALELVFEERFLPFSFACRKGKGNHAAVRCAQKYCRQYTHCAKLDIRHFFETVPLDLLMARLRPLIPDAQLQELVWSILQHGSHGPMRGLPIGNLTSQYVANFYLHALDAFLTAMGVPWIRYMDDVLLFGDTKRQVLVYLQTTVDYVMTNLGLAVKNQALRLQPVGVGVPFLGFRCWPHRIRLDGARKRRFFRRLRQLSRAPASARSMASLRALFAWVSHADSQQLCRSYFQQRRRGQRLQPGQPWWVLEQQRQEHACLQSQQQHALQPQQQPWFSSLEHCVLPDVGGFTEHLPVPEHRP